MLLQDLGESRLNGIADNEVIESGFRALSCFYQCSPDSPTDNKNNKFDPGQIGSNYLNSNIREIATASNGFSTVTGMNEGQDYSKLENAKKVVSIRYTFHPQLGYISQESKVTK